MWAMIIFAALAVAPARGEGVIAFMTAPEVGEPVQTVPLTGKESTQTTPGAHEGHRILTADARLAEDGAPPYAVRYHACLEKDKHPGSVDLIAKEGLSGLGLSGPTGANWYAGGCIDLVCDGQGLAPYRPDLKRMTYADGATSIRASWTVPWGDVELRFLQLPGDDKCYVSGRVDGANVGSVNVRLRCFPGGYTQPLKRVVTTASASQEGPGELTAGPLDCWALFADANRDVAVDAAGQGPCAVMFSRTEVSFAQVTLTDYPVETTLSLDPGVSEFRLILWEFPGKTNAEALDYVRQVAGGLEMEIGMPATAGVLVENVPPRAITVDGQPAATIWLPADPPDRLVEAAIDLQAYVHRASGAVLPIAIGGQQPEGHVIRLSVAARGRTEGVESFALRTTDEEVRITSPTALGALYGAYELLERAVGVRWYLPGPLGEVVPESKTIIAPELDLALSPSFPMRWIGRGEWALRNKQNNCDDGFLIYPGIYHTQNRLLPHREYFPEHPEYFALIDGKRSDSNECKLCYSNPDVAREIARNMARMLDENPNIDLLSLSPTDGQMWCECERCVAMDEEDVPKDQSKSRRSLLFYNAVAQELRKTHPEARILVGAYNVYNWPPEDASIKADPMLAVIITHYEDYCMAHPVPDPECPRNQRYVELVEAWENLGCQVYYYEYYWKVNWLDLPWPIVHSIRGDMPWYKERGHQGVYTQYNADNIWTLFPGHYVAARLLWDVEADVDAMVAKMYEDLFGDAAPAMKQYYALMEEQMATCGQHFPGRGLAFGPYVYTPEVRTELRRLYAQAVEANKDPVVAQRLEKVGLTLEYVDRLMEYAALKAAIGGADDRLAAGEQALAVGEPLVSEILTDRGKWGGAVSASVVREGAYLGRDVANLRAAVQRERASRVDAIEPLPARWRFALDPDDVGQDQGWFAVDFDDSAWKEIEIGKTWEEQGYQYDGFAWYRVQFDVKPEWLKQGPLALHFGAVDGEAWVYWHGEFLGQHEGWDEAFALELKPEQVLTDRPNLIAVCVFDGSDQGGIWKPVNLTKAK